VSQRLTAQQAAQLQHQAAEPKEMSKLEQEAR